MSLQTPPSSTVDGATRLLRNPRFELIPFDNFGDQMAHLPDDATITVTAAPSLGVDALEGSKTKIDATIDWSERAAREGYEVVPHLAARYIEDRDQLSEYVDRLQAVGITDVFVMGGDREVPVGEFESAYEFLVALDELGHPFEEVGITGYPEGHHFLDDETLIESMNRKAPHASYITTQICYDPETVLEWIEGVRDRGVDLPVEVGVPGVMKYQRLLGISKKVGVGDSMKYLQKTTGILGFLREFIRSRGKYTPDELVDGLGPHVGEYAIRGVHINTFNQVPDTENWRRGRLDR
jgi:methylenetetrahydrofolate reductase (NADPH)